MFKFINDSNVKKIEKNTVQNIVAEIDDQVASE